ncbi:MAG: hypothetical protein NVSMB9_21100 [Isosphaeraceae bacterium]
MPKEDEDVKEQVGNFPDKMLTTRFCILVRGFDDLPGFLRNLATNLCRSPVEE